MAEVSLSSVQNFAFIFFAGFALTLVRDAPLSMIRVARHRFRSVDTTLTSSTVTEVAFSVSNSSWSVGVHAQGESSFEVGAVVFGHEANIGRGTLGLPNLRKGLP
jgi:hypothetical protein